jgi:hypothetical protein
MQARGHLAVMAVHVSEAVAELGLESMTRNLTVEDVRNIVISALKKIQPLFISGVKLSFMARFPGNPERSMLVTNEDSLGDMISDLIYLKERDE